MKPFPMPHVDAFELMTPEERIASLMQIAEHQAYKVSGKNLKHLDDYKSAGWCGLWKFSQEFDRSKFENDSAFRARCHLVARNAIIDERRRLHGRFVRGHWCGLTFIEVKELAEYDTSDACWDSLKDRVMDDADSPAEALERSEIPARAEELMGKLDPRSEKYARLYYYGGYKLAQIGAMDGVSESYASLRLKQALRKLRNK